MQPHQPHQPDQPGKAPDFGSEFVVEFDRLMLQRKRIQTVRLNRIAAWGWLILAVLTPLVMIVPVAAAGLGWLAVLWLILLAGMVYVAVSRFVVVARCQHWGDARSPAVPVAALTFTSRGLSIGADPSRASYPWDAVTGLVLRSGIGPPRLVIGLRRGVGPDLPVTVGLEEADMGVGLRRRLGVRGPRLLLETLTTPPVMIAAAARHYSAGRATVRHGRPQPFDGPPPPYR